MTFHDPIWLYSTPVVTLALCLLFWIWQRIQRKRLESFAGAALLPKLLKSYSKPRAYGKFLVIVLGIASILFALARPQQGHEWIEQPTQGIDVLFALDASRSMLAEDIKPNRLERAKLAILDLLQKLNGDRVGLVAFAGNAFLQCPITLDYDAFRQSLEAIDTRTLFRGGSDLTAAIRESEKSLQENRNHKIVILLTDGEDLSGATLEQARKVAEAGVTIYTVGVGTPEGDLIPLRTPQGNIDYVRDEHNRLVKTKLDATTLSSIAEATGGFFVHLGSTGSGLDTVYEAGIASIPKEDLGDALKKVPIERFQWAIGVALLLLGLEPLMGTRKRRFRQGAGQNTIAMVILLLVFSGTWHPLRAENKPDTQEARIAAYQKVVDKNPQDFIGWFNLGTALYESGKYEEAITNLEKALGTPNIALQEKALYNMGNARYRQGQILTGTNPKDALQAWEDAIQDYQSAHELNPDDDNAAYNQDVTQQAVEVLKKQIEQQPPPQQQGDGDSSDEEHQQEDSEQKDTSQEGSQEPQQGNGEDKQDGNEEHQQDEMQEGQNENNDNKSNEQEGSEDKPQDQSGSGENSENEGASDDNREPGTEEALEDGQSSNNEQNNNEDARNENAQGEDERGGTPQDTQGNQVGPIEGEAPQGASAADAETGNQERGEDLVQAWDAMRREEAERLLDSLKAVERKLPFAGFGDHTENNEPVKDW
ncbi:MAG TPA: hypothetical protein DIU37_02410 [Opitutae bacterium]|nr:hypothetical protein [Opitutae bacterium]|tara:strand:+ start:1329 stop:3449 length:2121 start_codon:yes stop_codon:yes gene_type:complete